MTDRRVTVHLDLAVSKFLRNGKLTEDQIARIRNEAERLDKAASALTKTGLVASLAAVPGLLSPLAAGMAALPGLVLSGAAAFGTLAIATDGVGEAMKRVGEGDAEKLAEAMATLSVEAKHFVQEYQRVKPLLDMAADATQDSFFRQWSGDLELMTTRYLPTMLNQMPQLAAALGKATSETAKWSTTPGTLASVNRQVELATDLTEDFGRILRGSIGLMLDLSDASGQFNRDFVGGMADGVEGMRRWVEQARASGQMNHIFENAGRILSRLGDIAAETGDLLMDMAANPAMADAAVAFLDILHMMLEMIHSLVSVFGALPGPIQSAVLQILAVGGAAMLVAGRVAAMKAVVATASVSLNSIGPAGERAAGALQKGAMWAGRATAAFAALHIASQLVASQQKQLNPQFEAMADGLEKWAAGGKLAGESARVLGEDLEDLEVGLKFLADTDNSRRQWARGMQDALESFIPGLDGTNTSLARTRERVAAIDQALSSMVQSGAIGEADAVFRKLADSLAKDGVSIQELKAMFPQYAAAIESATGATGRLSTAHSQAAMNAAILSAGLAGAVKEAGSLRKAFDRLHGGLIAFAEAEIEAEVAIDRLQESFKENGKSLDVSTKAGQENKQALIGVVETAIEAAQAKYNETVATKGETVALQEASATYQNYIGQLRASMLAAGMNKAEVDRLLAAYASMPPMIATSITTPGLDLAIAKTLKLLELRRLLGSNVAAANTYNNSGYTTGRRWGGITQHARDGLLNQADVFSPRYPARYAFAEPATGGEAFVPRNGDYHRSMSILEQAAGWYGAMVMPSSGRGTSAGKSAGPSAADLGRAVKAAMQDVAVVLDGRVVGRIQAGQADLYARGG